MAMIRAHYYPCLQTTGTGIGVPDKHRRTNRRAQRGFFMVSPQHGNPYGRAVRGAARLTGSYARYANPHGLALPIGVGAARFATLHRRLVMPLYINQPAIEPGEPCYLISEEAHYQLYRVKLVLELLSSLNPSANQELQLSNEALMTTFSLFAELIDIPMASGIAHSPNH